MPCTSKPTEVNLFFFVFNPKLLNKHSKSTNYTLVANIYTLNINISRGHLENTSVNSYISMIVGFT